jgi:D-proline reductase (dithiol) PrdB
MSEKPQRTPINALSEAWAKWISGSERGLAVGRFASRSIALPQLKRLASVEIPWAPLQKPVRDAKVVLISTGGVHLRNDRPFNVNGDGTFRTIPRDAQPADLAITHQAYDRTDALRDINLVFPIERLRELARERVIGSLAEEHYGFGLSGSAAKLLPAQRTVARKIREAGVDLALLVPA